MKNKSIHNGVSIRCPIFINEVNMNYKEKINQTINKINDEKTLALIYNDKLFEFNDCRNFAHLYVEHEITRSKDETNLTVFILSLEPLFDDMCFEITSIVGRYMYRNGEYVNLKHLLSLDEQLFRIKIDELEDYIAYTDISDRKIVVDKKHTKNKAAILHEMIHAHEYILTKQSPVLKEILLLELYKDLKTKLPKLDDWIYNHANIPHNTDLAKEGGEHDLLFFLKSLDLDLKCGFEYFTIFGYDYQKHLL